jgi:trimethylguanosine synthase
VLPFLPRFVRPSQILSLALAGEKVELEQNFVNKKLKGLSVYFNELVEDPESSHAEEAEG